MYGTFRTYPCHIRTVGHSPLLDQRLEWLVYSRVKPVFTAKMNPVVHDSWLCHVLCLVFLKAGRALKRNIGKFDKNLAIDDTDVVLLQSRVFRINARPACSIKLPEML